MSNTVLIVDDSTVARKMMIKALPEGFQCAVTEAADGQKALELCRQQHFDVIFLDLTMPVLDGYATLRALQEAGYQSFICVVSADVQPQARDSVLALGARAFLKKPVWTEELATVLRENGFM
ncbi:MAG: response regulator [Gammaproteobacteria bacterium]|nr:response regulator [Gammaproteobacteria bacterium]